MKCGAVLFLVGFSVLSISSQAMEVKGLVIGQAVTEQGLADIFGSASCPGAGALVAEQLAKIDVVRCTVPISFLGIQASAKVYIMEGRAANLWIPVPAQSLTDIEDMFTKKYGAPTTDRPAAAARKKKNKWPGSVCSDWRNVDGGNISVCEGSGSSSSAVQFTYAAPTKIDESDI